MRESNIKKKKALLILLVIPFFAAFIAEGLNHFGSGLNDVRVIANCTPSSCSSTDTGLRIKAGILDKAFQDRWSCTAPPISYHASIPRDSRGPIKIRLPAKSGRAPPKTISS